MSRRLHLSTVGRCLAASAALLLVTATPAAADPVPPSEPSQATAPLEFVDAAQATADDLTGLDEPISYAEYAAARGDSREPVPAQATLPHPGEAELRKQCALQTGPAQHPKGWIASRFTSCQKRPYDLVLRDKRGTKTIGRLWFDMWTLGFATDGERRVDYYTSIENIRVQTVGGEDARKWRVGQHFRHDIYASGSDPDATVIRPQTTQRDELLKAWDATPRWALTYTSPDKGPQHANGNQQRVSSTVYLDVTADSPNATPYAQAVAHHSNVRYDYAGPVVGKHKGTVFKEARVDLALSRKAPEIKASTQHIYDALKRPELTFPSFASKTVPGEKEPLHRLIDKKRQDDQREKSIKECRKVWGNYTGTGLECDEYPFASTKEGSLAGDSRFSVRLIDGKDNNFGGQRINEMYSANRVLDGDPFYVKITN
ncbi:NucA/NucB deoxyribonuclease domain-containing protein [Streptomyces sp. NPDC002054]|uniref:NucA/NucB deoxyribonuclease domain-containing protein n=1 Tax=Streptomyces sp. NPDC002054 TaxID=3154663 RepID=UPI003324AFC2